MTQVSIGIDIGGTNTVFGLIDRNGTVHVTGSLKTSAYEDAEKFIQDLTTAINNALSIHFQAVGVGIGCPNANHYKGTMENAPNLNFKGIVPFVQRFEDFFSVPAVLTNDANAAAIGEIMFGGAKGLKDFLMITLGTGVGSGFVVNGQLIYGHESYAGELGHTLVVPDHGRLCACGRKGCLEMYASARGIAQTFAELTKKHSGNTPENMTAYDVLLEAEQGNPVALETFEYTAKILGLALSNAVLVTNPSHIFLFGGPVKAGNFLLEPLQKYMEEYMLFVFKNKVKLQISGLMDKNAAVLGAAALIWEKLAQK